MRQAGRDWEGGWDLGGREVGVSEGGRALDILVNFITK